MTSRPVAETSRPEVQINTSQRKLPFYYAHSRTAIGALTFCVFLSITVASWSVVKNLQEHNAQHQFDAVVAEAVAEIRHHFAGYEQVLKGGYGLLLASDAISRDKWRVYVEALRLDERYPGIPGIGFSQHINPADMGRHVASVRAEGLPDYKVWPNAPWPREAYTAIIYLEPFNARNRRALGYDMFSHPVRRVAMSRARDSGEAALSGKVRLVQETSQNVQAGILMYVPYYGPGGIPETLDKRRSSLIGYVYAPFRMDDFIQAILRAELDDLGVKIYDGDSVTRDALLFDSGRHQPEHSSSPRYARTVRISLYGQQWTIAATSRPRFENSVSGSESEFILLGGILVSILTAVVSFMLSSNKEKTTALAHANAELLSAIDEQQAAVSDLSIATRGTQRILESITDAFYALDREWRFTYVNNEALRLLRRRSSAELLGKNIWDEFPEAVQGTFFPEYHRALTENCTVSFEEFYAPLDGWFDVRAYPSVEGLAVYFRNVTERKRAEKMRREAEARIRHQASLLDKATDAIIVRGLDHRIQFWNQGAERLYGWTSDEVIGRSVEEVLYVDPGRFREAIQRTLRNGEWNGEIVQHRKDGTSLTVEAHWTLVRDDEEQSARILAINTDITARKMAEKEIHYLAFYDSLTGLPNRQLLLDRLKQALAISGRKRQTGALLFIDLDNFKLLNDTLGHDMGDLLLQQVAPRLISCVRDSDTVARLGGDEFVVVLTGGFSEQPEEAVAQIRRICDRIVAAFSQSFNLRAYSHHTTPSIGIAVFNGQSGAMDELLKQADLAMYQAKASGRNAACLFTPDMQAVMNDRVILESDLHKSWERDEFVLHFQPQAKGRRVIGAEALVRWQHPRRGLISPADFIAHAEETGSILPLGTWILDRACAQLAEWAKEPETAQLDLAVNVSPRQFSQPDFVEQISEILDRTGANPRKLKLELTESMLVRNIEDTIVKMAALKDQGVGFALDDFGTGYSSLYYLKRLPLDWVKIDQSFVRDVLTNPHDATIVRAIILLAKSMGLKIIAEGVETEAQRIFLARHGCAAYQGFLISQPLPPDQFREMLRKSRYHIG